MFQSLSLGLFRSDYLMQQPDANRIKQVEFNTVAASFGAITSNFPTMYRYRHLFDVAYGRRPCFRGIIQKSIVFGKKIKYVC